MALIDCKSIADKILEDINGGTLVVICNNTDPSAVSYVRQLKKTAKKVHVDIVEEKYHNSEQLESVIERHNTALAITPMIVVSPQPDHYQYLEKISPHLRVEGNDFDDNIDRVSCAARACITILENVINIERTHFLIIGYGKAVGKPLSYLLMRHHAGSVVMTHKYTPKRYLFNRLIPESDVIITAVGHPYFLKSNIKDKVIIDAGVSIQGNKIVGDVSHSLHKMNYVTPVPGGVGPVTTALLLRNVFLSVNGKF